MIAFIVITALLTALAGVWFYHLFRLDFTQ